MQQTKDILVHVRWLDGYIEKFMASKVRFGANLLWIRTENGQNRHIPLQNVRWYSLYPESHEETLYANKSDIGSEQV